LKILFTGGSSFTGSWFVQALAHAGHDVVATFRSPLGAYQGLRAQRVAQVESVAEPAPEMSFGEGSFVELLRRGHFEVLCHHGAEVGDYRSPAFDVQGALRSNTHNLAAVLAALDGALVVLTGTVFERGEGAGDEPLRELSPYGLSKTLTAETFSAGCTAAGVPLAKFVIANPFGPYEEGRFTSYLARTWLAGESASVQTPAYVRDNVHVSLLARAYVRFVEDAVADGGFRKLNPSGYVSTQLEFAERIARELEPRLGVPCPVVAPEQTEFPEPRVRVNTDPLDGGELGWDEDAAWDELAAYYRTAFA
jgi:nucleoside-diphosphate-sugar epimerase